MVRGAVVLWPTRTYRFSVCTVHGKKRPQHGNGKTWTPQETKDAEAEVAMAYVAATQKAGGKRKAPAGVPVKVRVRINRRLSAKASRIKDVVAEVDTRKPDVDNVLKTVMDALEGVAYENDSQVVDAHVVRGLATRRKHEEVEVAVTFPRMWDHQWNLIRDLEEV